MTPNALVITAPGINCDIELANAFKLAGAHVESVPLIRLGREPSMIDRFDLNGLPGGFSYGDDVAAGRVLATLIRRTTRAAPRSCTRLGLASSTSRRPWSMSAVKVKRRMLAS